MATQQQSQSTSYVIWVTFTHTNALLASMLIDILEDTVGLRLHTLALKDSGGGGCICGTFLAASAGLQFQWLDISDRTVRHAPPCGVFE